jgi:hypothetical protein
VPTRDLGPIEVLDAAGDRVTVDARVQASAGGGGRLAFWPARRFGVEASLFFTRTSVRVTDGRATALFDADVQQGSVRAMWQLSDGLSGSDFVLSAGLGGVRHGGPAFRVSGAMTDVGGAAGAGLHITVGPQVRLRIDGEAVAYRYGGVPGAGQRTQIDLAVTAGLTFLLSSQ